MKNQFHFFLVLCILFLNHLSQAGFPEAQPHTDHSHAIDTTSLNAPPNEDPNDDHNDDHHHSSRDPLTNPPPSTSDTSTIDTIDANDSINSQPRTTTRAGLLTDELIRQCPICTDPIPPEENIELGCKNHEFCKACLAEYFQANLEAGAFQVYCPDPQCNTVLSIPDFTDQKLAKSNRKRAEQILVKQSSARRYLNREFFRGCLSALLCWNFCGTRSYTNVEVCPNCKEVFEFTGGCRSVYHRKCNRVFLKNNQITIPCGVIACGCYVPNCCQENYGYAEVDDTRRSCNSCISCWCLKL